MKLFTKFVLLAGVTLGVISPVVAKADPIVASTSMSGTASLGSPVQGANSSYYYSSITLASSGSITNVNVVPNTAGVTAANSTVVPYFATGGAVSFTPGPFTLGPTGSAYTVSASSTSGGFLLASAQGMNNNGATLQFFVTSFTVLSNATTASGTPGGVSLIGNGYFVETASGKTFTNTAASFSLTSSTNGATSFTANAVTNVAATPEPSSLLLLGTGLVGAAGMLFRRRELA